VSFAQSKDERLLAFYDNVRSQVELDKRSGGRYRLCGDGVKHTPKNFVRKLNDGAAVHATRLELLM
jgi:hypothetical protein